MKLQMVTLDSYLKLASLPSAHIIAPDNEFPSVVIGNRKYGCYEINNTLSGYFYGLPWTIRLERVGIYLPKEIE